MLNFEQEPEYEETGYIERYFDYLDGVTPNPSDVATGLEQICLDQDIEIDTAFSGYLLTAVLHIDSTCETDAEKIEQYRLLPLRLLTPFIEYVQPLETVTGWYDDIAYAITDVFPGEHKISCAHVRDDSGYLACDSSAECPVRVLSGVLIGNVEDADFTSLSYLIDPAKIFNINIYKFQLARRLHILPDTPTYFNIIANAYVVEYMARFGNQMTSRNRESQS
jgi:hypothetical protein